MMLAGKRVEQGKRVGGGAWRDVAQWCGGEIIRGFGGRYLFIYLPGDQPGEGRKCWRGDWILRDAEGGFHRCTDEEFREL